MSFLLNKVIKSWKATKYTPQMIVHETPVSPPSPNISHLTQDEIRAIHNVIMRQAEFEKQEANRINELREELDNLQQQLDQMVGTKDRKLSDVRLCRLCFKTKFDDGMGRICEDCQQRVCQKCGLFSPTRWSTGKVKSERKWHCKLCFIRREVLCRTGGWYHGLPADTAEELKKKLSIVYNNDEIPSRNQSKEENRQYSCENRSDSEPMQTMIGYQKSQIPTLNKYLRRSSLLHDSGTTNKKSENKFDDEDDDKDSLKTLIFERQMLRRKRQQQSQRPRRKSVPLGVKASSSFDENKGDSADYSDTGSSTFSTFSNSSKSKKGFMSSTALPTSSGRVYQDALNRNSISTPSDDTKFQSQDNMRRGSVQLQRETSRESLETSSSISQLVKTPQTKTSDVHLSKDSVEKSMQKWRQSGCPNVYPVLLHWLPKGCTFGLKVTGGVQDNHSTTITVVTGVSTELKTSVRVGHEILEWNGEALRGQTYDSVVSVTSYVYPRVLLLVNPSTRREDRHSTSDGNSQIEDHPSNQTSELHGKRGKFRTLPRIPTEIKRGEIQFKLHYHSIRSELSVTVLKARHIVEPYFNNTRKSGVFVTICLVPGKSTRAILETDLQALHSHPEWNQTFVLGRISLTEMVNRALQLTVWSHKEPCDSFLGEVLLDLAQAPLDGQIHWYSLEDHDENSSPLPRHRSGSSAIKSTNLDSHSFTDSSIIYLSMLPEVSSHGNSPTSTVSQPGSFTQKVRTTMRNTVSKMSLIEKKDTAGSDDSISSEKMRRLSSRSDKSISGSKRQNLEKPAQNFNQNLDLLAPPQPLSRTSSCSSLFMSEDEDIPGQCSLSLLTLDRLPPDGEENNKSSLGPGQIPVESSTETTMCGDIKLGFMVSKGQLDVDIICASGLHWDGHSQLPDTYAKTYLMEGKKVIQSKKTSVVKGTSHPVYCKRINFSASNIHGRIMKITIWRRTSSFDKKTCLGKLLVRLDAVDLSKPIVAWYKLFQMNSTEYGSDEYLSYW